jgi:hypothetical protein
MHIGPPAGYARYPMFADRAPGERIEGIGVGLPMPAVRRMLMIIGHINPMLRVTAGVMSRGGRGRGARKGFQSRPMASRAEAKAAASSHMRARARQASSYSSLIGPKRGVMGVLAILSII